MTTLDRRDRRRARALAKEARAKWAAYEDLIPLIAAALKREREETGLAARTEGLLAEPKREK